MSEAGNRRLTDILEKAGEIKEDIFGNGGYWNFRYFEKDISLNEEEKKRFIDFYKSISNGEEPEDTKMEDIEYELRECYYDDKGKIVAWSEGITPIWAENRKDLFDLLEKAKKASYKNTVIVIDGEARDSGRKMKKNWKK